MVWTEISKLIKGKDRPSKETSSHNSMTTVSIPQRPEATRRFRNNRISHPEAPQPSHSRLQHNQTGALNIESHMVRAPVNGTITHPRGHGQSTQAPNKNGSRSTYAQAAGNQIPPSSQASEASLKRSQTPREPSLPIPEGPLIDLEERDDLGPYSKHGLRSTSSVDVSYPESMKTETNGEDITEKVKELTEEHDNLLTERREAEVLTTSLLAKIQRRNSTIEKLKDDLVRVRKERNEAEEAVDAVAKQDAEIKSLKEEIKNLKRELRYAKEDREEAEKDQVESKDHYEKKLAEIKENYRKARVEAEQCRRFADARKTDVENASGYIKTLELQVRTMELTISELNGDVAKLGNMRPGTKRDDAYFRSAYSRIFDACNQFARTLCRHGNVDSELLASLFPQGSVFCQKMAGPNQHWSSLFLVDPARIVESLLVSVVSGEIMNLGVVRQIVPPDVFTFLLDDAVFRKDEESQQMRILSFRRLHQHRIFQQNLQKHLVDSTRWLFNELSKCASIPPKPLPDDKRQKQSEKRMEKLFEILKDAATVYLEQMQEPAEFSFELLTSESVFNEEAMSFVEEPEVDLINPKIYICATPIVLKRKYNAQNPSVLYKAKVYLRQKEQPARQGADPVQECDFTSQSEQSIQNLVSGAHKDDCGAVPQVAEVAADDEVIITHVNILDKGVDHGADRDNGVSIPNAMVS